MAEQEGGFGLDRVDGLTVFFRGGGRKNSSPVLGEVAGGRRGLLGNAEVREVRVI